jgi:SOS-response transcriptional repressor LexA
MKKIIDLELEVVEAREMRYERATEALAAGRDHIMRVFGNSMTPIIKSRSKLTFRATDDYQVGDVVFCKVKGRVIDAHKISKKNARGRFMIANNKGHENGWTSQIYGRVIEVDGEPFGRSPDS